MFVVPFDGKVLSISSFNSNTSSKSSTLRYYKDGDDDALSGVMTTGTYTTKFSTDAPVQWTFTKGDAISISRSDTVAVGGASMSVVLEYDTTT